MINLKRLISVYVKTDHDTCLVATQEKCAFGFAFCFPGGLTTGIFILCCREADWEEAWCERPGSRSRASGWTYRRWPACPACRRSTTGGRCSGVRSCGSSSPLQGGPALIAAGGTVAAGLGGVTCSCSCADESRLRADGGILEQVGQLDVAAQVPRRSFPLRLERRGPKPLPKSRRPAFPAPNEGQRPAMAFARFHRWCCTATGDRRSRRRDVGSIRPEKYRP